MEDVAASEAVFPLHVERRSPLARHNRPADVGGVSFEDIDDSFRKRLRLGIPRTPSKIERGELRGNRHRMHPRRSHRRIVRGLHDKFEKWLPRRMTSFRIIV